ncbi:MAG TPA: endonuclease MutS2 [Nitrolancea sp.]|nr:endonuclease MutS2 [Nitrolancea sp.]
MPAEIARILEFDRVLERLAGRCQFSLAAARAREIGPSADDEQVRFSQAVTVEAVALLTESPGFTVGGARDVRQIVERAALGLLLAPADLRDTLDTVQASRSLRRSFTQKPNAAGEFPLLNDLVEAIADLPALEADLVRTVGSRGEILDSASPELGEIRREVKLAHRRLTERLNRMIGDGEHAAAIQDPIVTMREGRYVIPVRADRRGQVPGIVHATSASGQTLFVEPLAVVELNNRWRELQMAEEHEVERVLRTRSQQIGAAAEELTRTLEAIAALDLALAKARLAFDMRATPPVIAERPPQRVALRQARHPLLDPATVVPVDLTLGGDYRVLVVTGPNTGGKTVALKTLGLLAMMAQSGLFIPAADGSTLSVFDGIFADIGDEQSIEQSLSTFSSHMTKIIAMLRAASERSLLLIDELAAGTDPEEGAALARAIISVLLERGALAVVTTHYSELKAVAYATPGVENASAEFNLKTLAPTYRLITGIPGRSNALAIAQRLGLPAPIIEEARGYLQPEAVRTDELLAEIQRRRAAAEATEREARAERAEVTRLRQEAEEALREAQRAKVEARQDVLAGLEAELGQARGALRRVQSMAARPAAVVAPEEANQAGHDLQAAERQLREAVRRRHKLPVPTEQLALGDWVEVPSLGISGEIVGFGGDGESAEIQAGAFKLTQPLGALRRTAPAEKAPVRQHRPLPRLERVDQELHLRGMRVHEIEDAVDRYLDSAALASLPWVRLVHGKGTGALRSAVHDALKRHPAVARFELADVEQGGSGVTVVHLKE